MHLKSILTKNLDKFKSINRLRTATHLLGTCCNCTCCWFIYFWYRLFCFGFFVARRQVSQKTAPHVRLPKLRLKLEDAKKNWACAATPKTLTAIRLPLALSLPLSLARSSSHSLSLCIFLIACFALSSVRLDFRFRFDFVFIWAPRRELNLNLVLSLGCVSGCLFEWKSSAAVVALSSVLSLLSRRLSRVWVQLFKWGSRWCLTLACLLAIVVCWPQPQLNANVYV